MSELTCQHCGSFDVKNAGGDAWEHVVCADCGKTGIPVEGPPDNGHMPEPTQAQIDAYNALPSFDCDCGRRQVARIGEANAEHFGWRKVDGKWLCPFCSGNEANLRRMFMGGSEPIEDI